MSDEKLLPSYVFKLAVMRECQGATTPPQLNQTYFTEDIVDRIIEDGEVVNSLHLEGDSVFQDSGMTSNEEVLKIHEHLTNLATVLSRESRIHQVIWSIISLILLVLFVNCMIFKHSPTRGDITFDSTVNSSIYIKSSHTSPANRTIMFEFIITRFLPGRIGYKPVTYELSRMYTEKNNMTMHLWNSTYSMGINISMEISGVKTMQKVNLTHYIEDTNNQNVTRINEQPTNDTEYYIAAQYYGVSPRPTAGRSTITIIEKHAQISYENILLNITARASLVRKADTTDDDGKELHDYSIRHVFTNKTIAKSHTVHGVISSRSYSFVHCSCSILANVCVMFGLRRIHRPPNRYEEEFHYIIKNVHFIYHVLDFVTNYFISRTGVIISELYVMTYNDETNVVTTSNITLFIAPFFVGFLISFGVVSKVRLVVYIRLLLYYFVILFCISAYVPSTVFAVSQDAFLLLYYVFQIYSAAIPAIYIAAKCLAWEDRTLIHEFCRALLPNCCSRPIAQRICGDLTYCSYKIAVIVFLYRIFWIFYHIDCVKWLCGAVVLCFVVHMIVSYVRRYDPVFFVLKSNKVRVIMTNPACISCIVSFFFSFCFSTLYYRIIA